jgi:hypothetical protein
MSVLSPSNTVMKSTMDISKQSMTVVGNTIALDSIGKTPADDQYYTGSRYAIWVEKGTLSVHKPATAAPCRVRPPAPLKQCASHIRRSYSEGGNSYYKVDPLDAVYTEKGNNHG